jgi:hypothetical protein
VVQEVASALGLTNVVAEQARAEALPDTYDFVVSRAVTDLKEFYGWDEAQIQQALAAQPAQWHPLPEGRRPGAELAEAKVKYKLYPPVRLLRRALLRTKFVVTSGDLSTGLSVTRRKLTQMPVGRLFRRQKPRGAGTGPFPARTNRNPGEGGGRGLAIAPSARNLTLMFSEGGGRPYRSPGKCRSFKASNHLFMTHRPACAARFPLPYRWRGVQFPGPGRRGARFFKFGRFITRLR